MVTRRPFLVLALAVVVLALVTGWARTGQSPATPPTAGLSDTGWQPTGDVHRTSTDPSRAGGGASPAIAHADHQASTIDGAAAGGERGERSGDARPCVVRADCGGALVLGGLVLALALPVMAPTIGGLTPVALVVAPAPQWHPTPRSGRLFRPPRPS